MLLTRSARADGAPTGSAPREFVKAENSTAEESAQRRRGRRHRRQAPGKQTPLLPTAGLLLGRQEVGGGEDPRCFIPCQSPLEVTPPATDKRPFEPPSHITPCMEIGYTRSLFSVKFIRKKKSYNL